MILPMLSIEITRQCPLECAHCLRGEKRDQKLDLHYLDHLLDHIDQVYNLVLTGGEPLLEPGIIYQILNKFKEHKIEVSDLYIATSGICTEPGVPKAAEVIGVLAQWYSYVEQMTIEISTDIYHLDQWEVSHDNLIYSLRGTTDRDRNFSSRSLINEGRGPDVTSEGRKIKNAPAIYEGDILVHLSATGKVCWSCDLSYDRQDREGLSINRAFEILREKEYEYS